MSGLILLSLGCAGADSQTEPANSKTRLRHCPGNAACSFLCAVFCLLPCSDVCLRLPWCRSPRPRICRTPRGCCAFQLPTAARSFFVTRANSTLSLRKAGLPVELRADQVTLPSRGSHPTGHSPLTH